jgi:hypothetical protein
MLWLPQIALLTNMDVLGLEKVGQGLTHQVVTWVQMMSKLSMS